LWLNHHPRIARFVRPGFVGVVLAQLVVHAWSNQVLLPREVVRKPPAILAQLSPPEAAQVPRLLRRARDRTPITVPSEVHAFYLYQLAIANVATRFGFGQVPGYSIAGTPRFDALALASGQANLERIMDLFDIRYLLIEAAQAVSMGMPIRSERTFAGHVVLENLVRRPRAFVAYRYRHGLSDEQVMARLFRSERASVDFGAIRLAGPGEERTLATDEPSPCAIERPIPEHVILHCQATQAGYAVLLDEWTRGWSATVDGVGAPIERADVVFRAIPVPAGSHRIEMRYRTPGLRSGGMIALGAWLGFLVLVGVWLKVFRSSSRPGSPLPRPGQQA
jgi:hypothetical protein